jgi:hypothetical protein
MSELKDVLMARDGLSEDEADELIADAQERVLDGENPEEILQDEFGLEPDFVFDLI